MYIHLGNDVVVKSENVVGIFDLDSTTVSKRTREYLKLAEKKGEVKIVSAELPKSFIVVNEDGKQTVYLSQISSATLCRRSKNIGMII